MQVDDEETAAAEVTRLRVRHGQSERDGYSGIHGIAALLQYLDTDGGGITVDRGNHPLPRQR